MAIYYFTPDNKQPSWGIGMLYTHVELLRSNGFDAWVLHDTSPFRPHWLESDAPVEYLFGGSFHPCADDTLVVPEIRASRACLRELPCRRIVFVQGSSLIVAGLGGAKDYRELGYERAIAILPHARGIIERHFGIDAPVIPPCVAPYFFQDDRNRRRRVLLYPKWGNEDYPILTKLLRDHSSGWEILELKDKTHREVAALMGESAFFVSVGCQESFNATVPEAMAAGCIAVCYEAFGGQDFLKDGVNAHVFPNHHIFPLAERVLHMMENYDGIQADLQTMRIRARSTAHDYTRQNTEKALLEFYRALPLAPGPDAAP